MPEDGNSCANPLLLLVARVVYLEALLRSVCAATGIDYRALLTASPEATDG